jgi:SAM-dependent methyltransferase
MNTSHIRTRRKSSAKTVTKHHRRPPGDAASEQLRMADLLRLLPLRGTTALDAGACDGRVSRLLTERYERVTALDLAEPEQAHARVRCIQGDVTALTSVADRAFDVVVCTDVLEHVHPERVATACSELMRVCRQHLLVGVRYRQDLRVGRTTCTACGTHNPPCGHVNAFDERRLQDLFKRLRVLETSFVSETTASTNAASSYLMDLAGNPYGTYGQLERCVCCGARILEPPVRSLAQRMLTQAALLARLVTEPGRPGHASWIHVLFAKESRIAAVR